MLQHALKEWAVICQALAAGQQAVLLRKGGIADDAESFQLEHKRFWLFPTYVHQQSRGIKAEALPLLEKAQSERPLPGVVRLTHFAEVPGVYQVQELPPALLIGHLHLWSEETVRQRFAYRRPGLCVMPVRVYATGGAHEIPDTPQYAGCRSWVELERELPTERTIPVLDDESFRDLLRTLDNVLNPTALA